MCYDLFACALCVLHDTGAVATVLLLLMGVEHFFRMLLYCWLGAVYMPVL